MIPYFMNYLRVWDVAANRRVDYFVAISDHVRKRIEKHYRRPADVIYPPVDSDFYTPDEHTPQEDFFLMVSAFAPYKRLDIAIEACNRLSVPLKIIGQGQDARRLQALAGPTIEFLGALSDEEVRAYYRRCRALLFPGEEDFGIVPLEVQACGRPVIAYAKGGVLETTVSRTTCVYFQEQTVESLIGALRELLKPRHFHLPLSASMPYNSVNLVFSVKCRPTSNRKRINHDFSCDRMIALLASVWINTEILFPGRNNAITILIPGPGSEHIAFPDPIRSPAHRMCGLIQSLKLPTTKTSSAWGQPHTVNRHFPPLWGAAPLRIFVVIVLLLFVCG